MSRDLRARGVFSVLSLTGAITSSPVIPSSLAARLGPLAATSHPG